MAFELDQNVDNIALALRELEAQAPKHLKGLMIRAAVKLDDWNHAAQDAVRILDEAAALRIGQMDSQSKVDEVQKQVKLAIMTVAERMRQML